MPMPERPSRCHAEGAPMPRDNDQDGTPQGVFGAELRYHRERAGLSQTDLAALVNVSHDVISKIETGERPPAKDFPERLDAVPDLDTRDGLARLWGTLRKGLRNKVELLADISARPKIGVQVVPSSAGAHAGLLGAFIVADLDSSPGMVYLETAAEGYDTDSPAVVAQAVLRFDTLRSEALPR